MAGPLNGVRVIELPAIGPVPFLGMLLADLGAEVIRVDKLPEGRPTLADGAGSRTAGPGPPLDRAWTCASRAAPRWCCGCAETADVLIEGFRPGVAERLGIGPDEAHARNPRLVYGRMTGWGQDGPLAAARRPRHHLPRGQRVAGPPAVAVIAFALAWSTLLPGVGYWDTAEFQAVPPLLGTLHPTASRPTRSSAGWGPCSSSHWVGRRTG